MNSAEIENIILRYLPPEDDTSPLPAAVRYSVMNGGKRIRPQLLLETCRLFSDDTTAAEPFAAAIEMIHSGSLVHDDLPCMDNDELRRGKPSAWKAYGEDQALMAGDALMACAFKAASYSAVMKDPARAAHAIAILADSSGMEGVCLGQSLDMMHTGKLTDGDTLELIYNYKTAALIRASMKLGALAGGADETARKIVDEAGLHIGLAFQIRDDILDVTADVGTLGKPVGSDEKNQKYTYVNVFGMETAQRTVEEHSNKALELINSLPGDKTFFNSLINKLANRNY